MAEANSIDRDAFANWISGFTDGEGCFNLTWHRNKRPNRTYLVPGGRFEILLRRDDAAVLEKIKEFFGVGSLNPGKKRKGANPAAHYYVSSAGELQHVIVPHFDRFPLHSKKSRDFEIWKQAINLLCVVSSRPRNGWHSPRWKEAERHEFSLLHDALKSLRGFTA